MKLEQPCGMPAVVCCVRVETCSLTCLGCVAVAAAVLAPCRCCFQSWLQEAFSHKHAADTHQDDTQDGFLQVPLQYLLLW
jgi:hypothetical protein